MAAVIGEIETEAAAQNGDIRQVNDAVALIDEGTLQKATFGRTAWAAAESLKQQAPRLLSAVAVAGTEQQPA